MERDAIWQAFAETGEPLYYLLYKHMREPLHGKSDKNDVKKETRPGNLPRAED